ncbi:MAG: phosphotransferase [Bacillota bacterium]|nr:phosphotransferase [Bacillota bacterium]
MINPEGKALLKESSFVFQQLKTLVEDTYKLGTLNKAYEIFGGYVNRSFGVEMTKPNGEDIDYFVRKYRTTATDEDIRVEHSLVTYAIEKGMDVAAGVVPLPSGATFTKVEEEVDGKTVVYPFAVYRYLYGDDTYDWINTNLKPEEDYNLGALQAKFHNFTNGFNPGEKAEPQIYDFLEAKKEHFIHCPDGLPIPERDRYIILYKSSVDEVLANCDKARKGLEDSGMLETAPKTPCHCDYHPGNVKWQDGKCIGIFDFDWSKLDYRLFDICFGLVYTVSAWEAMQDGILHMDRVKTYLQGYNDYLKNEGTLTPLTKEEAKAFPYMMLAGVIYLFNWATDYFNFWEDYNEFEWYYYLAHIMRLMHFVNDNAQELEDIMTSVL